MINRLPARQKTLSQHGLKALRPDRIRKSLEATCCRRNCNRKVLRTTEGRTAIRRDYYGMVASERKKYLHALLQNSVSLLGGSQRSHRVYIVSVCWISNISEPKTHPLCTTAA